MILVYIFGIIQVNSSWYVSAFVQIVVKKEGLTGTKADRNGGGSMIYQEESGREYHIKTGKNEIGK